MAQSRTRCVGMEVPTETMAGASVAQEPGADGTSLGPIGPRQGDSDQRLRQRPAKAQHRIVIYEAGPWGSWRSRSRQHKDDAGGVVAPSLMPQPAGERVTTDRRAALQRARLARSGARTPVSVPPGADEAIRALPRAREDTSSDRKDAPFRLHAFVLRQALR